MHGKNSLHMVLLEDPGGAQVPGSPGGFLRALEHQQHIVGKFFFFIQAAGQLQKNRHVPVVAAGMHAPGVPGGIGSLGTLGNGQGVRVRPESNGLLLSKVKPGAKRRCHGRKHPAFEPRKSTSQVVHGLRKLTVQLRDLVQGPAVIHDLHLPHLENFIRW